MIVKDRHCIGKVRKGHTLDCNHDELLRACRRIEPRLYFKWNPYKREGHGLWELRIRPLTKSAVYAGAISGTRVFTLEYKENDFENHVKDFNYLNFGILQWLRDHDTQGVNDWQSERLYQYSKYKERVERQCKDNQRDMIRDNRKYFRQLQEDARSGRANWAELLKGIS